MSHLKLSVRTISDSQVKTLLRDMACHIFSPIAINMFIMWPQCHWYVTFCDDRMELYDFLSASSAFSHENKG